MSECTVELKVRSGQPIDMASALIEHYMAYGIGDASFKRNIVALNELAEHIQSYCKNSLASIYADKI